jgi:hypothetical protein
VLVHFLLRVVGYLFCGGCQTLAKVTSQFWELFMAWVPGPIRYRGVLQHLPVPEVCKNPEWNQMKSMLLVG